MPATFLSSQTVEDDSTPQEHTVDNPQQQQGDAAALALQKQQESALVKQEEEALKEIRRKHKQSWAPKRQALVRRVLRAFEYLKNNPYGVMNYGTGEMDNIAQVVAGNLAADDPDIYKNNDNVYQMLCLSFMAALGPDMAKTRWMPDDPENEDDLSFAENASTMMGFIERMNDMPSLQMLKLLYLWTAGTYFVYARNLVSAQRAGTTKKPVYAMQDTEVFPNRYLCPKCGTPNPEKQYSPFVKPSCFDCGAPLGAKDWYPAESMPMPVQTDTEEQPNSFTGIDIFCLLNIDVDPDADELVDTPILDLEGEKHVSAVRAMYPDRYGDIKAGDFADGETGSSEDRRAREMVKSSTSTRTALADESRGSFSRCWIHSWAFNSLDDQNLAQRLLTKYPTGVKIVTFGQDLVLEVRGENMLEHWTDCKTMPKMGANPFGVGDVALSLQDRVDDTANNIHIYMDRMALPPVLANASLVDVNSLGRQRWGGGRAIPVYPALKTPGLRYNLSEAIWQPTFHADTQIYSYSQTLIQLMQLLTGVQPQIFGGGTTRGVDTASGQQQMLNTAMGRLMMFLTRIRSENSRTAKLAVKCMATDIDGQKRLTVEGQVEDQYENAYILESQVQGEIYAYPQADQGFPASYGEMRDRLIQILGMVEQNPVLQQMLSDPDTQKLMAMYLLPPGVKMTGDALRRKVKLTLQKLSQATPVLTQDPQTGQPSLMPSIPVDPDFDKQFDMVAQIALEWGQENFEIATSNPKGFANVRAYLKLASAMAAQNAAKQAALQTAAGQPQGAGAGAGAGAPGGAS